MTSSSNPSSDVSTLISRGTTLYNLGDYNGALQYYDNKKKENKVPHTTLYLLFMRAAATSVFSPYLSGDDNNKKLLDILMQDKMLYHFLNKEWI